MRLPRRAILVRALVYGPLLAYFGWRAYERYSTQRAAERREAQRRARIEQVLESQSRPVTLPDGTVRHVPVVTPEQARELWGIEVPASKPGEASMTDEPNAAPPGKVPAGEPPGPAKAPNEP